MIPEAIRIMDPRGVVPGKSRGLAPRIAGVAGTTAGFRVQWPSFDIFMERVEEVLKARHGVGHVEYLFTGSDGTAAGKVKIRGRSDVVSWNKVYDDFTGRVDWAISGLAA